MRYSANLVKEIIAELEKVPIIRQVCSKVGLDHSTFYRWMIKHPEFYSQVMIALTFGRKKFTDAAESIILTGIQNKEYKSATFWLKHNEPRYMSLYQGKQHENLVDGLIKRLDRDLSDKNPATFERLFEVYYKMEKDYEPELVEKLIQPVIDLLCIDDPRLGEVFPSAYAHWKKEKNNLKDKLKEAGENEDEEKK